MMAYSTLRIALYSSVPLKFRHSHRPQHHDFHRTSSSNGRTRRSCPLLGDALVRVRTGTYSRAKANEATMHQKHRFHQRRRNPSPKLSISSFGRLCLGHFRTTENRQKGWHSHSMADIGRASMPSQNLGIANEKNSVLQGSKQEFSNLSRKTQESDHQYNRRDDRRFIK